jgi:hypothetical protein
MEHFSMEDWIDFTRGIDRKNRSEEMKQHLDRGCVACTKTEQTWRQIVNLANHETTYEPPAWALQAVMASFRLQKSQPALEGKFELAKLIFDSALQPLALGVRSSASVVRQLLYRSGTMCIDMRMQPKPGSQAMVLIGQLMDSASPDHGLSGIPVSLLCKGDTLSQSKTNAVGEFDFGLTAADHLQLVFGLGDSRKIVVPVPDTESVRTMTEA